MGNNKVKSLRSSRRISNMINSILLKKKEVDKTGNQFSVHYPTINNYLKEFFGKPRKIWKLFFLVSGNFEVEKDFKSEITNTV